MKYFNKDGGYGFIRPLNGTTDIFFHVTNLADGFNENDIKVGYEVGFFVFTRKKDNKTKAVDVTLLGAESEDIESAT